MNKMSLKQKILLLMIGICITLSFVSGLVLYRNSQTSELYQTIALNNLPKVQSLGTLQAQFRMIRIQVRSLGLTGNKAEDNLKFAELTKAAMNEFLVTKEQFSKLKFDEKGTAYINGMDKAWKDFYEFGGELLQLSEKGDPESIVKMNEMVRVICPIKSKVFSDILEEFIIYQNSQTNLIVSNATQHEKVTVIIAIVSIALGLFVSLCIGIYFANAISNSFAKSIRVLNASASEIEAKSHLISDISIKVSEASVQQASSLQQTVASIDEISAMISRNSESARNSEATSLLSKDAAANGKEKVELMLKSIHSISEGNDQIITQINKSNNEISEIVKVIQNISQKTQVINDIVFQTKLLSFNASVEAARAGVHGNGFAVVAEEVGNLAAMSGKAANEITQMLTESTGKVTGIVENTRQMMDRLVHQSKDKIEIGTKTAKDCADALEKILSNVSSVNEMIKEISTASEEQSIGVNEVNKAMNELDRVTSENSSTAKDASHTASDLKTQAESLNKLVSELTKLVEGKKTTQFVRPDNVYELQRKAA